MAMEILWEVSEIKPGHVFCGLLDNSLRGSSPRPVLYRMDLNGNKTLYGKSLGSNQAAFVMDFSMIVFGGSSPQPFLYRIDLNGDKTLYGKSLGSNQVVFVADFSTIVSGVQSPGHSYT